ncbi:MAG TPA: lysophospholipid acyltransferase family protein [Oleiagrimonas sp.]|nr:lysophospholipid acyltransferase family protein [Oleiagrimonas sp.]
MNTSPAPRTRHRDWWRPVRYLYRIPLLFVHFLLGLLMCVLIVGPRREAVARDGHEPLAHRLTRWWSKGLMRIFGFRTRQVGQPLPDAAMFVCNHVTWLDIELVHSQRAASFVAKAEIARWPVVGWLAACGGTIFHKRGSNHSLSAVMQVMVERMRAGRSVAVFPEGGTSHNGELRVFHARIFQAALDAEVPVQPVALRYTRHGQRWLDVAFRQGESFAANIVRILGEPACDAEVHFLPVVPPSSDGRRRMAEQARARIERALNGDTDIPS